MTVVRILFDLGYIGVLSRTSTQIKLCDNVSISWDLNSRQNSSSKAEINPKWANESHSLVFPNDSSPVISGNSIDKHFEKTWFNRSLISKSDTDELFSPFTITKKIIPILKRSKKE